MKSAVIGVLFFSSVLFAQDVIPSGTVLAAQLNGSLDSRKVKAGHVITARLMQDVPLPGGGKIPAGAKIVGRVTSVSTSTRSGGASMSLHFHTVRTKRAIAVTTNLRALASMMDVEDAQVPPTATDRGTPWAWMTTNQIGGEVVYGQGGPVTNGSQIVGQASPGGVLVRPKAKPGSQCRGPFEGNDRPQAFWVFSSDACGLYGFSDLTITHAGRTAPSGQITLTSRERPIHISGGSGLLLRVN